jgi:hypothetical protein
MKGREEGLFNGLCFRFSRVPLFAMPHTEGTRES